MKPYRFEIYQSKPFGVARLHKEGTSESYDPEADRKPYDCWYWRCRAPNGRIVVDGSEGYKTAYGCKRALTKFLAMMQGMEPG